MKNTPSGGPDKHLQLNQYGADLSASKKWDKALAAYSESLTLKPGQPQVLINIAKILEENNNKDAAISAYKQALLIQPDLSEAKLALASIYVDTERLDEAEPYCAPALDQYPMSSTAHYNYGRVLQHKERGEEAILYYQKAIAINPKFPRSYYYLGNIYQALGHHEHALKNYLAVTTISPEIAPAHFGAGQMYQLLRQLDKSLTSYKRVVALCKTYNNDKQLIEAYVQIGFIYNKLLKQKSNALQYFKMALEIDPGHAVARHYMAAVSGNSSPKQAPDKFVTQLFDDMSDNFEHALVHQLRYQTPELILKAVRSQIADSEKKLKILDLGCGTGLCGRLFKEVASFLVGVDLSPKMIGKSKEKNIYDKLIVGELTSAMNTFEQPFDVVLAADVFVYIGDLGKVFSACNHIITNGGLFSFSIEVSNAENRNGYILDDSGRYAHRQDYIAKLSNKHSFQIVAQSKAVIRMEGNQPVNGYIYVLKKEVS